MRINFATWVIKVESDIKASVRGLAHRSRPVALSKYMNNVKKTILAFTDTAQHTTKHFFLHLASMCMFYVFNGTFLWGSSNYDN